MKKVIPVAGAIMILILIWAFIRPSITNQQIQRKIYDLHSQDLFTPDKIKSDKELLDQIYEYVDSKGIYSDEIQIEIERTDANRIKTISVDYTDYIRVFGYELMQRNFSFVSKAEDLRRKL
jgi:hypothetical protein